MNYFLVSVPLAYVNAVEAQFYYGITPRMSTLIVFYKSQDHVDLNNIKKLINPLLWKEVIYLPKNARILSLYQNEKRFIFRSIYHIYSTLKYLQVINASIKGSVKASRVFLQDMNHYPTRYIVNRVQADDIVYIDEGLKTATIFLEEKNRHNSNGPISAYISDFFKEKFHKIFGYNVSIDLERSVTFFTTMNLEKTPKINVDKNTYIYHLKNEAKKCNENSLYFIGQSLTETGKMSLDDYIKVLRDLKNRYDVPKFVYCPHREDSEKKLDIIKNDVGYEIVNTHFPLELSLIQTERLPKYFVSFFSTALLNLNSIFHGMSEFICVDYEFSNLSVAEKQRIEEAYKQIYCIVNQRHRL